MHTTSPTFFDLFSGCGGFSMGFQMAGFSPIGAIDWDRFAMANYRLNHPKVPLTLEADIGQVNSQELLKSLNGNSPDVVISGSPCQGFSTVGKRRLSDPRNLLLITGGRLAVELKPKVFVAENVTGAVAGDHQVFWKSLKNLLQSNGYRVEEWCCSIAKYGLPQLRKRMFLIAWRGMKPYFPPQEHSDIPTLRDVIARINVDFNHQPEYLDPESDIGKIAMAIRPGQKLCNVRAGEMSVPTWKIPEVFGRTNSHERKVLEALRVLRRRHRIREFGDADPVSFAVLSNYLTFPVEIHLSSLERKGYVRKIGDQFDLTHTFNGKFRRLNWERSSPTIDTRCGDPRYLLHPEELRGLTVREAARIQGFPDHFVFEGPVREQYRMIGNAVPPPVAASLAKSVSVLLGRGENE